MNPGKLHVTPQDISQLLRHVILVFRQLSTSVHVIQVKLQGIEHLPREREIDRMRGKKGDVLHPLANRLIIGQGIPEHIAHHPHRPPGMRVVKNLENRTAVGTPE